MIFYKTNEEIEIMRQSGKILAKVLYEVAEKAVPGAQTSELDLFAESRIHELGGEPSFKLYQPHKSDIPFPSTICISINDEVVHAPATPSRVLKQGDVVGLDLGVRYQGFCTDMAITVGVGKISQDARRLIMVTEEALRRGIAAAKINGSVSDIGRTVQEYVEAQGFGVVRDLVGHGVGRGVHEDPRVYNYIEPRAPKVELTEGLVIAIEPMVTAGSWQVKTLQDGWTVVTQDGKLAAHFEHTIAITKDGPEILTSV